jgi:acyl-CoA thioesterase
MRVEPEGAIDLAERARSIPFLRQLGLELLDFGSGSARMQLRIRAKHHNYLNTLHGGAICSLIDSVAYFALRSLLARDIPLPTLEMKVNFLRPLREGTAHAEAQTLHPGKRVMVAQVRVTDSEGQLCAFGTVSCLAASGEQ